MNYLQKEDFSEILAFLTSKRNRLSLSLFFILCFNVLLAPIVQAATPAEPSRFSAYSIALLGLITFSLCIYLFVVIFQPEKF